MYTSGWPKIQNRCCHSSGSAPASTVKNVASNWRWNISRNSATVITGMANSSRNWTTRIIQVNTGMRISVMPGARMLSTVTIRLIAPVSEAMPVICRPSVQKSMPLLGENGTLEFGGVHEPAAVGRRRRGTTTRLTKSAPNRKRPEAEGVDAREGDVAGADLQRHEVVAERRRHRHGEEEHHRRGVHREHLVVEVGGEHRAVGPGELGADQQRLDAADEEEHDRRDAVHDPELLVVDREQPRPPAGGRRPGGGRSPSAPRRGDRRGRGGRADDGGRDGSFDDGHGSGLPSLALQEVGDELVDLVLGEAEVRHAARLAVGLVQLGRRRRTSASSPARCAATRAGRPR